MLTRDRDTESHIFHTGKENESRIRIVFRIYILYALHMGIGSRWKINISIYTPNTHISSVEVDDV